MSVKHILVGGIVAMVAVVSAAIIVGPIPPRTECNYGSSGRPDMKCTPGVVDPAVTQTNIDSTICVPGYTATVRPPTSMTNPLKARQMKLYGQGGQDPSKYEEDHLISLELGGSPDDPRNLWPEPYAGQWGARVKDQLENELHRRVCNHSLPLAQAQHDMATDWVAAHDKYIR